MTEPGGPSKKCQDLFELKALCNEHVVRLITHFGGGGGGHASLSFFLFSASKNYGKTCYGYYCPGSE